MTGGTCGILQRNKEISGTIDGFDFTDLAAMPRAQSLQGDRSSHESRFRHVKSMFCFCVHPKRCY